MAEINQAALERAAYATMDHMHPSGLSGPTRSALFPGYLTTARVAVGAYLAALPPEVPDWGPEAEADTV